MIAEEASRALARIYGVRPVERVERPTDDDEAPDDGESSGEDEESELEDDAVADSDEEEDEEGGATGAPTPDKIDRLSRNRADWERAIGSTEGAPQRRLRGGRPWDRRSALAMLRSVSSRSGSMPS